MGMVNNKGFSDIEDCIFCLDKLITDPNIKSLLVNIGPGPENQITINTLYQKISNILKFNKDPVYKPERVNEVKKCNLFF